MNRCLTFFAAAWVAFFHAAGPAGVHAALPLEVVSEPYTNIARAFGDSTGTLLSADGRWVVFNSSGNGLATNDANGLMLDVFIRDTETAATTLVSRNAQGFSANGDSLINGISADGRLTVFESDASDLVPGDTNDTWDVSFMIELPARSTWSAAPPPGNPPARPARPRSRPTASSSCSRAPGPISLRWITMTLRTCFN